MTATLDTTAAPVAAARPLQARALGLLAAERTRLLGHRSLWWCSGIAVALGAAIVAGVATLGELGPGGSGAEYIGPCSLLVFVLAALPVTGDYRYRVIRSAALAVGDRRALLLARTGVVAAAAGLLGLLLGVGGHLMYALLVPGGSLLPAGAQWRAVLGWAPVFALYAVIVAACGVLLRNAAAAIIAPLVWAVLEGVVSSLPFVPDGVGPWLPMSAGDRFVVLTEQQPGRSLWADHVVLGPWGSLALFALFAGALLWLALVIDRRRDA
jgi:ABC-2 type transport system permease protein